MFQRFMSVVFGLVGLGFIGSALPYIFDGEAMILLPLILGGGFVFSAIAAWKSVARFEEGQRRRTEQNFEWYKKTYPEHSTGRIKCHSCECDRIFVRRLLNQTFFNAHICHDCGTTLYYTPE